MTARTVVGGSLYVAATVTVAAVAAWPVYASASYLLLVGVAVLAAAAVAALAAWRRWGAWPVAALLAGAFALLAVPLAVPSRLGGFGEVVRGLGEAAAGLALAWKDLLTVELPVGSYRTLLVPALVVFLVGTSATLLLSWRRDRWSIAAVPVGLAMTSFGLLFGRTSVSEALRVGPFTLQAPVETALGALGLAVPLLWLAWRTRDARMQALQRASSASGVRGSGRPSRAARRRGLLGAGMVVTALVVAVAVVPWAARGVDREVLRSAATPERELAVAASPLIGYRAQFSAARADEVLFRVAGDAPPERVRLATLDTYDGETYRAGAGADDGVAPFTRVPAELAAGEGVPVDATVTIDALGGIWMPTAGRLASVSFAGDRAAALADGFYYSAEARAGVETAGGGLVGGDSYRLRAVEPITSDVADLVAPGGAAGAAGAVAAPEALRRWVAANVEGTGGRALAGLVGLLRERGFLSHALDIDAQQPPSWLAAMPGYTFQSSASGHSLARVDALFSRLLEREGDPRAAASGNYVAAVGDDEQFAVAVALIARELGFPARVVVGARLVAADPGLAVCGDDGACRAQDLSAWTEVLSADGQWVSVDVTPQWTRSPSLEVTEQRDPENVTEVRPDGVAEVAPPAPAQEESARDDTPEPDGGIDLAWLWPVLRVVGISLLVVVVLIGPFAFVMAAKATRRRRRRRASEPAERIAGGWEEYVDAGVDAGRDAPRRFTRSELARGYGSAVGERLAVVADRAVFSREAVTVADAEEFWLLVDEERRLMRRERGVGRGVLAAVSLRSFVRLLLPRSREAAPRLFERGERRTPRRHTP